MMNSIDKPAHKGIIETVKGESVAVRIGDDLIMLPRKLIAGDIHEGDEAYLSVLDTKDYKEHHKNLSKTILNTIFGTKS
jgi:hypothetical protein